MRVSTNGRNIIINEIPFNISSRGWHCWRTRPAGESVKQPACDCVIKVCYVSSTPLGRKTKNPTRVFVTPVFIPCILTRETFRQCVRVMERGKRVRELAVICFYLTVNFILFFFLPDAKTLTPNKTGGYVIRSVGWRRNVGGRDAGGHNNGGAATGKRTKVHGKSRKI